MKKLIILNTLLAMLIFGSYSQSDKVYISHKEPLLITDIRPETVPAVRKEEHDEAQIKCDGEASVGSPQGRDIPELQQAETGQDQNFDHPDEERTYLGVWTITAYCPCEICCGEYSSGYTASGTIATEGRTVACNILPIGTAVMIGDQVYIVEDTGWSPYDTWIDIYFDSHEAAEAFGLREMEVYLIG